MKTIAVLVMLLGLAVGKAECFDDCVIINSSITTICLSPVERLNELQKEEDEERKSFEKRQSVIEDQKKIIFRQNEGNEIVYANNFTGYVKDDRFKIVGGYYLYKKDAYRYFSFSDEREYWISEEKYKSLPKKIQNEFTKFKYLF